MRKYINGKSILAVILSLSLLMGASACGIGGSSDASDRQGYERDENDDTGSDDKDNNESVSDEEEADAVSGSEDSRDNDTLTGKGDNGDNKAEAPGEEDKSESSSGTSDEEDSPKEETNASELPQEGPVISKKLYNRYETEEDTYNNLYSVEYETFILSDTTRKYYPGLSKAIDDFNKETEAVLLGPGQSIEHSFDEAVRDAKQMAEESEYFSEFFDKNSASITRLDDKLLSIEVFFTSYYGGAHAYYGNTGYTYDAETGKRLSLTDIVSSMEDLRTAAREIFSRDYPVMMEEDYTVDIFNEAFDDENSLNWTMGPESLKLYFNPYHLASFAEGQQTLELRYDIFPDLFNKGYGAETDDWVVKTQSMFTDLDGDGSLDYINVMINSEYNEEYEYSYNTSFEITAGNETKVVEYYDYDMDIYIARRNGSVFLILDSLSDNDYHNIFQYELTGDDIIDLGEQSGAFTSADGSYEYGEGYYTTPRPCVYNPDYFYISNRMNLVSTYDGVRACRIGDSGVIEPVDKAFSSYTEITLTSRMDLDVEIVDEEGNVTGSDTIKSGSAFVPYKSDNETYVDFKLSDGRLARVNVDDSQWPHKVNGMDLEEVFDGTLFAG